MEARQQERELRRSRQEQRRRRMVREAWGSVYRRVSHLTPVALAVCGELHAFPLNGPRETVIEALAPDVVFGFETALELRGGRRVLTGGDLHAYTNRRDLLPVLRAWETLGSEMVGSPSPNPAFRCPPRLFLLVREVLPPFEWMAGSRVVTGEWLIREYLGTLGQRFDLLAVVLDTLEPAGQEGTDAGNRAQA